MSQSTTEQPASRSAGGGKRYGYQSPQESYTDTASVEDEKEAVVNAFDHFLDALAARMGSAHGGTGTVPDSSGGTGTAPASSGGTTSQPGHGSGATGTTGDAATGSGSPGTTAGQASGSSGTVPKTGTGAPSAPKEAHEASLYVQREAYRIDRARETARRARRPPEALPAIVPTVVVNPHMSDSNLAPITAEQEFAPAFGSRGKPQRPTREVIAVPPAQRPETVPAAGTVHGLRPIDAYWASYGTAVDRAAARANLDHTALEIIIGTDDRVRVSNASEYPWRCICSLLITASTGAQYLGTAWLVGPRLLLTAGHCVYMSDEGGWVREIEVIPGRDADQRPFGSAMARDFRSVTGWTQDGDSNYDYGAILLPEDSKYGEQLGWFGYASRGDDYLRGITVNLSGYPGDGGPAHVDGTQWFDTRTIEEVQERQITYVADTYGGQSGAPVWETTSDGSRYGVAVHTFGTAVHNGGTRITGDVFDNIVLWSGQAP
jgi:glutamyl endopeptidase